MSLAQSPTFPAPLASLPISTKYQSAARALHRKVCSGSSSTSSFSHLKVELSNCVRNCSRLTRICLHVRDNASRALRSILDAIDVTILQTFTQSASMSPLCMPASCNMSHSSLGILLRITTQCLSHLIPIWILPHFTSPIYASRKCKH